MNPSKASTVVVVTLLLLLSLNLCIALAASGGRMGGGSFSKKSSSSFSSLSHHSNYHHHHHHHHHHRGNYHQSTRFYDSYYTKGHGSSSYGSKKCEDGSFSRWVGVILTIIVVGTVSLFVYYQYLENRVSVIIVQVGLSGKARSLQRELNEICNTTDTSSSKGWHHVLTEASLALLRHSEYFISGHARVKEHSTIENVEESFKELSSDEREKFDMESLVNVNNLRIQRSLLLSQSTKLVKDYMVVTVLLAAKGAYKLPAVRSIDDIEAALTSLNVHSDKILAVEVLWTPQDEKDSLSEEELLENYPLLRPV